MRANEVIDSRVNAQLQQIVAGVAHEARNPIFAISALLESWELETGPAQLDNEYLQQIRMQLARLTTLLDAMQRYSAPVELRCTSLNAGRILDLAIDRTRERAELAATRIYVTPDSADVVLIGCTRPLVEALCQMLDNAISHTPPQGLVRVACRAATAEPVPSVEFEVWDSGPGFSEDCLARALEPFYSRRQGSLGMGLAMVQRIAEAHGGYAQIDNPPEGGARQRLILPCDPAMVGVHGS